MVTVVKLLTVYTQKSCCTFEYQLVFDSFQLVQKQLFKIMLKTYGHQIKIYSILHLHLVDNTMKLLSNLMLKVNLPKVISNSRNQILLPQG